MENANIIYYFALMTNKNDNLETEQKKRPNYEEDIWQNHETHKKIMKIPYCQRQRQRQKKTGECREKNQQTSYEVVIAVAKPRYSHVDYANTTVLLCDCVWVCLFFLLQLGYYFLRCNTNDEQKKTPIQSCAYIYLKHNNNLKLPTLI